MGHIHHSHTQMSHHFGDTIRGEMRGEIQIIHGMITPQIPLMILYTIYTLLNYHLLMIHQVIIRSYKEL